VYSSLGMVSADTGPHDKCQWLLRRGHTRRL